MHIIERLLSRKEFIDNPPVLVDIGAAGAIHPKWKSIAKYSICIAFDADNREMGFIESEFKGYRKLYVYNRIVTDAPKDEANFYLTASPQCSSLLRPRQKSLNNWLFADLFRVEKTISIKTVALPDILKELNINKIDWFKTDSQGTDLRLFRSLGDGIVKRVLIAEFEPGILDAYEDEDKLWSLMGFMEQYPFWMADIAIKGSQRINREVRKGEFGGMGDRVMSHLLKISPGWGEVTYLNGFLADADYLDKRDFLLGWVFAIIEKQYGFALEIANTGEERFKDDIFVELRKFAMRKIKTKLAFMPFTLSKKIIARFFRALGAEG